MPAAKRTTKKSSTKASKTQSPKVNRLIKKYNKLGVAALVVAVSCFAIVPLTLAVTATPAPTATDTVATQYGNIGKWMLQSSGAISNYGGQAYQGKTLYEVVNAIIVDPTSTTTAASISKLSADMSAAGFPSQFGHSTGFKGLISGVVYTQQPSTMLSAFSDGSATSQNDHGRVFGPAPVSTGGYVYSAALSTETPSFYGHSYVSSNTARNALASGFVKSGQKQLASIALSNAYNTSSITTGDHDGNAIVIVLK